MKRPTWATVVGVLGIIFACFGMLGSAQDMLMPMILTMQKEIFIAIEKEAAKELTRQDRSSESGETDVLPPRNSPHMPPEMFGVIRKMWNFPEWFGTWSIFSGLLRLLINALYLVAAIMFLLVKPFSIRMFYFAAGISIAFSVIRAAVLASSLSFVGLAMMFGTVIGMVIDVILIVVIALSDKTIFRPQSSSPVMG